MTGRGLNRKEDPMKLKNPFVFPYSARGAKRLEYAIIAAGIAVAILVSVHAVSVRVCANDGQSTFTPLNRSLMTALIKETIK